MEEYCMYHICIDELTCTINELVDIYHNDGSGYLQCWVGDESHFDDTYLEKIEEYSPLPLTKKLSDIIRRLGKDLEKIIEQWLHAERVINIRILKARIQEYIATQFKQEELKGLFYKCSC